MILAYNLYSTFLIEPCDVFSKLILDGLLRLGTTQYLKICVHVVNKYKNREFFDWLNKFSEIKFDDAILTDNPDACLKDFVGTQWLCDIVRPDMHKWCFKYADASLLEAYQDCFEDSWRGNDDDEQCVYDYDESVPYILDNPNLSIELLEACKYGWSGGWSGDKYKFLIEQFTGDEPMPVLKKLLTNICIGELKLDLPHNVFKAFLEGLKEKYPNNGIKYKYKGKEYDISGKFMNTKYQPFFCKFCYCSNCTHNYYLPDVYQYYPEGTQTIIKLCLLCNKQSPRKLPKHVLFLLF